MSNYIHGRVLKGADRRELIQYLSFHRAEFEIEYEGKRIVPCDRDYLLSAIPNEYRGKPEWPGHRGTVLINLSPTLIKAVQKQVPARIRQIKEFGPELKR